MPRSDTRPGRRPPPPPAPRPPRRPVRAPVGLRGRRPRRRVVAHAALEGQLALEVGVVGVAEGDAAAVEQLDEGLDDARIELGAGDAPQLGDRLLAETGVR